VPDYIGKHISTPEDVAAINNVVEQFRTGIINKDGRQINALMLNSHVLFSSAPTPAQINTIREKYDPNFDGIFAGGLQDFCQFLSKEKGAVEEKFYNIKITQDDHTAWVMFDYEFQMEHQTQNYGVETWELAKDAHDQWKIISVVWSVHMAKS
jgi:hypothetical protein